MIAWGFVVLLVALAALLLLQIKRLSDECDRLEAEASAHAARVMDWENEAHRLQTRVATQSDLLAAADKTHSALITERDTLAAELAEAVRPQGRQRDAGGRYTKERAEKRAIKQIL